MQDPLDKIELTAAVQGLRDQLVNAVNASEDERIRFEVEGIDLDFTVELRRDANAKAGFKAWLMSGDAQIGASKGVTHRVSLQLRPKFARNGEAVDIGNESHADLSPFGRQIGAHDE